MVQHCSDRRHAFQQAATFTIPDNNSYSRSLAAMRSFRASHSNVANEFCTTVRRIRSTIVFSWTISFKVPGEIKAVLGFVHLRESRETLVPPRTLGKASRLLSPVRCSSTVSGDFRRYESYTYQDSHLMEHSLHVRHRNHLARQRERSVAVVMVNGQGHNRHITLVLCR